jgi:hypothetical protein
MNVGFTGTRHGMTDAQAAVFEGYLSAVGQFHHGSCRGADVQAARIVRRSCVGPTIVCHPGPEGDQYSEDSGVDDVFRNPLTHFARNRNIVDETDELIACPCDMTEQPRGGTWYTVNYARKNGKKVTIIWPDGSIS